MFAQAVFRPDKMETVLYGAAYYPEYMPYERLDKDVELMKQAGISVVRMGESSWGLWEPEDGRFEYAWMDRVVEQMHKAGIKVIMGTPTYSIPAWMYKKHPEIVMTKLDGHTITYGMRQNADLLNPTYRFYCERIIRNLAEHYKDNPAVIGWQIDNETPPGGAANKDIQDGFVEYLQHKFKTVDELNKNWGLNYWGQRLNDWTEIPPQAGILNPGWKLEWTRYSQWITTDFLAWQAGLVNQYKRPDQFVTQDFAGPPRPEVNENDISKSLDIVAANPYHGTQDEFDGEGSSYEGDYSRSLKHTNYWPSITADGMTLMFTRQPNITNNPGFTGIVQEDFYVSNFENKVWQKAYNAGAPLNTIQNEGAQTLSSDGSFMFFTACNRPGGIGNCDIYFSAFSNGKWSEPSNLGVPVNTKH